MRIGGFFATSNLIVNKAKDCHSTGGAAAAAGGLRRRAGCGGGQGDDAIKQGAIFSGKWLHAHAVKRPGDRALPWCLYLSNHREKVCRNISSLKESG
jgi:hypothetical protein